MDLKPDPEILTTKRQKFKSCQRKFYQKKRYIIIFSFTLLWIIGSHSKQEVDLNRSVINIKITDSSTQIRNNNIEDNSKIYTCNEIGTGKWKYIYDVSEYPVTSTIFHVVNEDKSQDNSEHVFSSGDTFTCEENQSIIISNWGQKFEFNLQPIN